MTTSGKFLFCILLANAFGLVAFLFHSLVNGPDLANKPEWSALQAIELRYRSDESSDLILTQVGSYDVIGIKSPSEVSRTWVLASPHVVPRLKILPMEFKVRIIQSDFEIIKNSVKLNEETELFLRNSIEN